MTNSRGDIPKSVVQRYTRYLTFLQGLKNEGIDWVSSKAIAEQLSLTSSTVRQDLSHLDFTGKSKKGYEVEGLEKEICAILGLDGEWNVVVAGAGNLGMAIAQYPDFSEGGFNICGIFDVDEKIIGTGAGRLTVLDMADLEEFVRENHVDMGILAVPDSAAQDVADVLLDAGVEGILNFTSAQIVYDNEKASCVDARIAASLQELSHAVAAKKQP